MNSLIQTFQEELATGLFRARRAAKIEGFGEQYEFGHDEFKIEVEEIVLPFFEERGIVSLPDLIKHWSHPDTDRLAFQTDLLTEYAIGFGDVSENQKKIVARFFEDLMKPKVAGASQADACSSQEVELLPQDKFASGRLGEEDTLIISASGNDFNHDEIHKVFEASLKEFPEDSQHDKEAFENRVRWVAEKLSGIYHEALQAYATKLVEKTKPKNVFICAYSDFYEFQTGWATDLFKYVVGGGDNAKGFSFIRELWRDLYNNQMQHIKVHGTQVYIVPLFNVLDRNDPMDFAAQVEPSVQGGMKMAIAFSDLIDAINKSPAGVTVNPLDVIQKPSQYKQHPELETITA